jgi:hypothetical protein
MEDSVENRNEVEKFLVYGCEDPNDDKLDILSWWKNNVSKYKIFLFVNRNTVVIYLSSIPVHFSMKYISIHKIPIVALNFSFRTQA